MFTRAVINNNEQIESLGWYFTALEKFRLAFRIRKAEATKEIRLSCRQKTRKVEDADAAFYIKNAKVIYPTNGMVVVKSK